tara:strand:+ start:217 stop:777 length:561 start_codon:yes stop_codon:yes gene_type:complete
MQILKRKLEELKQDPSNARTHDERNKQAVKDSLEEFGQQKPIVINEEGYIIAGNCTAQAAQELGWKEVAVLVTELDELHQTAFAVADNRTAQLASWDDETLKELLDTAIQGGISLETMGFNEAELQNLNITWPQVDGIEDLDYDERKHEKYTIKVQAVAHDDKEDVLGIINDALKASGHSYKGEAF